MTTATEETHDWDGCLMCAVRTLTEGRPPEWTKDRQPGDSVTGVILRQGEMPTYYEPRVPYVDLWLGGIERVRVAGYGMSLRQSLLTAQPQVGDTMTVTFEGEKEVPSGRFKGKTFRSFVVWVERGHH